MIKELRIENFAIIDHLELNFGPGLSTFTGETGAGKSILLDAIEALMGGRAENIYRVGKRGHGYHKGRGNHRGGRQYGHRGHHGRPVYIVPRYRFYGGPSRHHHYYYDDSLGVFLLGGVLVYYLNE